MTPQEFKSWFDGFTEALADTPSKAQWTRIKERVAEIDGRPVTERIYLDRYWPAPTQPWWRLTSYGPPTAAGGYTAPTTGTVFNGTVSNTVANAGYQGSFNSSAAMLALGRSDAQQYSASMTS